MTTRDKYDMSNALSLFFTESRDMLLDIESCLLSLEKDPTDIEMINALFRAVHTIKGSSGMFNFSEIENFTHRIENALDSARRGVFQISSDLAEILLEAHDYIGSLLNFYESNPDEAPEDGRRKTGAEILVRLSVVTGESAPEEEPAADKTGLLVEGRYWHISLRYGKSVFKNGLDPISFINYLGDMGEILSLMTIKERIPPLAKLDPEECYLGFEIVFDGQYEKQKIVDVFEFVRDDCEIRVLPPMSRLEEYVALINGLPETPMRIGEILVKSGSLTARELETALALKKSQEEVLGGAAGRPLIGEILVKEGMLQKPIIDAAVEKQKEIQRTEDKKNRSIRIDADKIDDLINIVGELVITGANLQQLLDKNTDSRITQSISTMSRLIEHVRDRIMSVRMVQVGDSFKKFERIVRDLGRETGKEIDLKITGGDTELDKTLIEKINDPLTHLIRNSIDHGIDLPDERSRNGKNRRGTISINAFHETGSVVIEIKDDGNGLNKMRIRDEAVANGLISGDQNLADHELYQLIFEPGFSTAEKVTNISGRGVGMNVVRRNIEALRGSVAIESEPGKGMSVQVHLPLTLAIIEGFMITVGDSCYIVPLELVREVFEISGEDLSSREGVNILNLRGEVLPFMRLRDFFGIETERQATECVMVVEYARKKAGLVIDQPIGEFQTVIKSLGKLFQDVSWASGATILGSGEVALVLDVPRIIQSECLSV